MEKTFIFKVIQGLKNHSIVKKIFIVKLFVIVSFIANGQDLLVISGNVLDSKRLPVPYCSVYLRNLNIGATTDSNGYFSIKVPQGYQDTAQISMIGYKKHTLYISTDKSNLNYIVNLDDSTYFIKEVVIKPRKYTTYEEIRKKPTNIRHFFIGSSYTAEVAQLFSNPFSDLTILKGIHYYRGSSEQKRTTFRIKIYTANEDRTPSDIMLNTNDIIVVTNRKGYVFFDLSKYNIEIPQGYYYLAIEWLMTNENMENGMLEKEWIDVTTGKKTKLDINIYNPNLGSKEIKGFLPIIYYKNFKGVWSLFDTKREYFTFFPVLVY